MDILVHLAGYFGVRLQGQREAGDQYHQQARNFEPPPPKLVTNCTRLESFHRCVIAEAFAFGKAKY